MQKVGLGNVAVVSFFVLSGYVISEAVDVFYRGRPAGSFIGDRALRFGAPFYWAALAVSVIVQFLSLRRRHTALV